MKFRFPTCDLTSTSSVEPRLKTDAGGRCPGSSHSAFSIQHSALIPASPRPRVPASPGARPGFSFTEILFAVMILGIGFIMVAAMFPVALQQTENSTADTTAASIARSGVNFVSQLGQTTFVSVQQPTGGIDQSLSVLTPTIRLPSGARNAFLLWQNTNTPTPVFKSNFPALGAPPLPTSLT